MASEIIVQTIKGPTSGANANKVIIPSGQTLDASNGLKTPAGHVIQVQSGYALPGVVTTTSTTFIDTGIIEVAITPKEANSKIYIEFSGFQAHMNPQADNWGGAYHIYRSVNSGSYGAVNNSTTHGLWANYKHNQTGDNWDDRIAHMRYLDLPSYNLGNEIKYRVFFRKSGRGTSGFYANHTGGVGTYIGQTAVVGIAMEFAQ